MQMVMEILVTLLFLTLGVQPQQVGVGIFLLRSMLAETLILVGMYLIYIVLFYQMSMKIINFLLPLILDGQDACNTTLQQPAISKILGFLQPLQL